MKGLLLAASMTLLCASSLSTAQAPGDIPGMFKRVDVDGDGRITPEELRRDAAIDFDRYDLDRDGVLSRQEVEAQQRLHLEKAGGLGRLTPAQFRQMVDSVASYYDFDGDGRITREDYIQRGISLLKADFNGDGVVTREEFYRLHQYAPR